MPYREPQPEKKPNILTRILMRINGSEEEDENDLAEEEEEDEYPKWDDDFV